MSPVNLLIRLGCRPATAQKLAGQIIDAIQENGLPYHNLAHVHQTLSFAQTWGSLTDRLDTVLLALWFHDLIYDPQKKDNEAKSAAALKAWLAPTPVSPAIIQQGAAMIMATQNHSAADAATGLVVDADLSILSSPPNVYSKYSAAIRQEYSWVDDQSYRAGRLAVLLRFLERPAIYFHRPIADLLEADARRNLSWEIYTLRNPHL